MSVQEIYEQLPETYQKILLKLAETMLKQSEKGKEKYGVTMDENTNPDPEYWHKHLMEEIADGLVYMQKLLQTLGKKD
jgi:hypothetical protein